MEFRGRNITVVGLARSGVAAANLLQSLGARVTVTDMKPEPALKALSERLAHGIRKALGSHPEGLFTGADMIVVSPGVPSGIGPLVKARGAGVPVIGELELAYALSDSPFIAITGTNGKSTTTSLVGDMLKTAGMKVYVGGNLGNALTDEPERLKGQDYIVAEVSSFQLETTMTFRPRIAAVLNITEDHLDRYAGMEEYARAKARVSMNQEGADLLVLNADDPPALALAGKSRCRVALFSRGKAVVGAYLDDGMVMYAAGLSGSQAVMPADEIRIKGTHNLENALAAVAIALAAGVPPGAAASTLREFPGLPHRMEFVRELGDVTYINDSKGTNVGAVLKSLEGLTRPVILIAGGLDKHSDFSPLAHLVRERVKKLVLIGKAADVMDEAIGKETDTVRAATLEDAIKKSRDAAVPGDLVLLSPACASFDMFRDFEERGDRFKEIVGKL